MKAFKLIIRFIILPVILTILFNFLEYGFSWDRADKFILPILLASVTVINFFVPRTRVYFLMLSFVLLAIMVGLYLIDQLTLSTNIGSFGFAVLILVVISYIPELLKKGYIEKF